MAFNNSNSVISIPSTPELEPGNTGKFSACFWYKPEDISANLLPRLWEKGAQYMAVMGDDTNSEYRRIAIEVSNGTSATEFWARPLRLVNGTWYHVVGTFDQDTGNASIYINGEAQSIHEVFPWSEKSPRTMSSNQGKDLLIGNRASSNRPASGAIKDFLLYDRVVSSQEVINIKNRDYPISGLLTHHLLSNGSGSQSHDISGNGHDGTLTNTEWIN